MKHHYTSVWNKDYIITSVPESIHYYINQTGKLCR